MKRKPHHTEIAFEEAAKLHQKGKISDKELLKHYAKLDDHKSGKKTSKKRMHIGEYKYRFYSENVKLEIDFFNQGIPRDSLDTYFKGIVRDIDGDVDILAGSPRMFSILNGERKKCVLAKVRAVKTERSGR